jgi:RNA polymerase sigma-70 factor (ECF subfamily)
MTPSFPFDLGRYRPLLRLMASYLRLAPRLQSRFDRSDLVNETLKRAWEKRGQFAGNSEAELVRWLQTILHNVFREWIRREGARYCSPDLELSLQAAIDASSLRLDQILAADQTSPSEQLERRELMLRWAEAVERLPKDQRDVILLRDLHELPIKQIAERTERTEKSVAGLLARGHQQLRQDFSDDH